MLGVLRPHPSPSPKTSTLPSRILSALSEDQNHSNQLKNIRTGPHSSQKVQQRLTWEKRRVVYGGRAIFSDLLEPTNPHGGRCAVSSPLQQARAPYSALRS